MCFNSPDIPITPPMSCGGGSSRRVLAGAAWGGRQQALCGGYRRRKIWSALYVIIWGVYISKTQVWETFTKTIPLGGSWGGASQETLARFGKACRPFREVQTGAPIRIISPQIYLIVPLQSPYFPAVPFLKNTPPRMIWMVGWVCPPHKLLTSVRRVAGGRFY